MGTDNFNKEKFCHYVSVIDTLEALFSQKSFYDQCKFGPACNGPSDVYKTPRTAVCIKQIRHFAMTMSLFL